MIKTHLVKPYNVVAEATVDTLWVVESKQYGYHSTTPRLWTVVEAFASRQEARVYRNKISWKTHLAFEAMPFPEYLRDYRVSRFVRKG